MSLEEITILEMSWERGRSIERVLKEDTRGGKRKKQNLS